MDLSLEKRNVEMMGWSRFLASAVSLGDTLKREGKLF
jgi:hypothetical protein